MKVAVVGSGISGLGAAYLLARAHDVQIFEQDSRAGGHTRTVRHAGLGLDMGFLVHNEHNYPLLGRLFRELGVASQESEMSFSVSCPCGLEYSGRRPFAQPGRSLDRRHLRLLWEIGRWLRTARSSLEELDCEQWSLERYLDERRFSERFRRHFLVPLTAALWSTAPGRALEYPAASAIRFFDNHGMLGFGRFRWRSLRGGNDAYVQKIAETLGDRLHLGSGARSIRRFADRVELSTADGERTSFDAVVIAVHADQALGLLEDPSEAELRALGAIRYTRNETTLHTDSSRLPATRAARAAWNYRLGDDGQPTVTYYLNRLQRLESETDWCVTLNGEIPAEHVVERTTFDHPLFTTDTVAAQSELRQLSGARRTWYAGAYLGNGFHEDGLASGVAAAEALGAHW
jgi:predicted NAD/FAD-binding protein